MVTAETISSHTLAPAEQPTTKVLVGPEQVLSTSLNFFSNARNRMDICTGRIAPNDNRTEQTEALALVFFEIAERGGRVRLIGNITKEYVDFCRQLEKKKIELRHLAGVSAYFAVSDSEYLANPGTETFNPNGPLLYSNEESFVKHHQSLFDMLWSNAVPLDVRIREVETGAEPSRTEVIRGADKVTEIFFQAVQRAKTSISTFAESSAPKLLFEFDPYQKLLLASRSRGVKIRYITEITRENMEYCKRMMDVFSAEVRHAESLVGNFSVTETEFVATSSVIRDKEEPMPEIIYSNVPELVQRNKYLFDNLWEKAIPAAIRFAELEKGEIFGETKLTFSTREILDSANRFVDAMKEEALVIVTEENAISRNLAFFKKIFGKAKSEGAKVKILGRFSNEEMKLLGEQRPSGVKIRTLGSSRISNLSLGIYDRKGMGLVQYLYNEQKTPPPSGEPYLSGIVSTDPRLIAGIAAIFDSIWEETDLRHRAELLQDILSHDIRNYSQVTKLTAELLLDQVGGDSRTRRTIDDLERSIDDTTKLIEKAQKLSKVLSETDVKLYSVDLMKTIEDSLNLIKEAYRDEKMIVDERKVGFEIRTSHNDAFVLADELLGSVFENIYSNCARYTDSNRVIIETELEEEEDDNDDIDDEEKGQEEGFWKISISDHGRGIQDILKGEIFTRYLESERGSGLECQ
jgi:two-component system sensor histidine kinase VicK